MKVKNLSEAGFRFGTYAGSKKLVDGRYWDTSASLEYRPSKGGAVHEDDEIDWSGFAICNYGSSSCVAVKIKISSLEDIASFERFF